MRPGPTGRVVPALDVAQTPLDLRGGVGLPVRGDRPHLAAGESLRDSVRAGAAVRGAVVPPALLFEQLVEAGELVDPEPGVEHQRTPGLAGAGVLVAGRGDGPGVLDRSAGLLSL